MNEKILINDTEAVSKAISVLKNGGLLMHPTETCYGFAVDVFNKKALDKLYEIKGRYANKPLSILANKMILNKGSLHKSRGRPGVLKSQKDLSKTATKNPFGSQVHRILWFVTMPQCHYNYILQ